MKAIAQSRIIEAAGLAAKGAVVRPVFGVVNGLPVKPEHLQASGNFKLFFRFVLSVGHEHDF
jgi:hypothetical protein